MASEKTHIDTLPSNSGSVVRGGLTFRAEPRWDKKLFGPDAPDWTDLSGDDRTELIKSNPRRTIWRVRYDDLDVHVKRYELGGLVGSLKSLFRHSPVASEFQNLLLARSLGVSAPQPLAFGQKGPRGIFGPSVLITATVPQAQPLPDYLRRTPMDQELADLSAELLGRLHLAGRTHPDLHLANLAVSAEPDGRRKLYLFDLQKLPRIPPVRLSSRLEITPSKAKWHLAFGYMRFSRYLTDCHKQGFLRKYLRTIARDLTVSDARVQEMLNEIEQLGSQEIRHRWAKRDLRAGGTNKYFARIRLPDGWRGSVLLRLKEQVPGGLTSVSQFTPQQWSEALARPLKLFDDSGLPKARQLNQPITMRRLQVGSTDLNIHATLRRTRKQYPCLFRKIPLLWQRTQAQHAFEMGFALLRRFIPTVLPLAWLRRREGLFTQSTILITEVMPPTVSLSDFLTDLTTNNSANFRQLTELASKTATLAGDLVDRGFIHLDLQPANLLLHRQPDGQMSLLLLGLEHIHRCTAPNSADPLKMLARAYLALATHPAFTRTVRLRFLLEYLRRLSLPRAQWKHHWQEIDRLAKNLGF